MNLTENYANLSQKWWKLKKFIRRLLLKHLSSKYTFGNNGIFKNINLTENYANLSQKWEKFLKIAKKVASKTNFKKIPFGFSHSLIQKNITNK